MLDARSYQPNAKANEFHKSPAKYRLLLGAAGSAKTTALCMEDIMLAFEFPGSHGGVFRRTYPALRDTTKRSYRRLVPNDWIKNEITSEGREEIEFINGSKTIFRCLDDELKLGSYEFDRASIDEARELDEFIFRSLTQRMRGQIGPRRLIAATNPPDEDHWLHEFFVDEPERDPTLAGNRVVIHSSTYDNQEHLPEDYIHELEKQPPAWRNKFLHGNWGFLAEGKPVFQEFRHDLHVTALQPVKGVLIARGWDFGFRHPACVWVQITPTGHFHILHELMGTDEELHPFATRVLADSARLFPGFAFEDYCDAAGNQRNDRGPTAVQLLQELKVFPNFRKIGIHKSLEKMRYLLRTLAHGQPLLQLNETCRLGVKAFAGGYYMSTKVSQSGEEIPQKGVMYDDWMDAARYAIAPQVDADTTDAGSKYAGRAFPRLKLVI